MMSKRSPSHEEARGGKRRRDTITSLFADEPSDHVCSACIRESSTTNSDCIHLDLTPATYFRLALMIADPETGDLLQGNQDETVELLSAYARRLAVESELALNVILMLHPLLKNFCKEGVSKLIPVVKKTDLHHARELKFIHSCLGKATVSIDDNILCVYK